MLSITRELCNLCDCIAPIYHFLGDASLRTSICDCDLSSDHRPRFVGREQSVSLLLPGCVEHGGCRFNGCVFTMGMGFLIRDTREDSRICSSNELDNK